VPITRDYMAEAEARYRAFGTPTMKSKPRKAAPERVK
jgi:hypothetical protein